MPSIEEQIVNLLHDGAHDEVVSAGVHWLKQLSKNDVVAAEHPLGFTMLKLFESNQAVLRAHVWLPARRNADWPIHDHMFNLRSAVLVGRLENTTYTVSDNPNGSHVLYFVEYDPGCSTMIRSDRVVSVQTIDSQVFEAGEVYDLEAGIFHSTAVGEEDYCLTLMLAEAFEDRHPYVVGPAAGELRYKTERTPVPAHKAIEVLRTALTFGKDL